VTEIVRVRSATCDMFPSLAARYRLFPIMLRQLNGRAKVVGASPHEGRLAWDGSLASPAVFGPPSRRSNVRVGSHTKPFPRVALGDRLARYLRCSRRSRCTSFSLPEDIVARVVARVERAHPFNRLEEAAQHADRDNSDRRGDGRRYGCHGYRYQPRASGRQHHRIDLLRPGVSLEGDNNAPFCLQSVKFLPNHRSMMTRRVGVGAGICVFQISSCSSRAREP